MAHIKEMHLNILRRVLVCFYHGAMKRYILQEFRLLLPPAAVCRVWRECMLSYVYERAYLEYHIKETEEDSETAQPKYEWKSNIDLIVAQRLSSVIKRLRIESFECPLNFTDLAFALDTVGFSSSHWRAVNVLRIITAHVIVVDDNSPSSSDDETLATQLTEYFGRYLPNISNLFILIEPRSSISRFLSNKLVNLYINQLHSLFCHSTPVTFNCHSFSSKLKRLTVGIAGGVTNRLPQLLASPLEKLVLFDIPHNFAWWTFIGIAPGHIEFTNLRELWLKFRRPSEDAEESNNSNRQVNTSAVSLNVGCCKLLFPKLKQLTIYHNPYNDGALYSMFVHSPLQTISISGSFKSLQHMDPGILFIAENVRLRIQNISPEDYHDYAEFCSNLLRIPCNATAAWLRVYQSSVALPIPSVVEWINLIYLYLEASIHLASVIQITAQLPTLNTIHIENIIDEVNEAGANLPTILEGSSTQAPSIVTNVKSLFIYSPARMPLVFNLDVLRYLTVLIRSLDKVIVPDLYVSDIKEFSVRYENSFPHLHDMNVLGASEVHD